MVHACNPYSVPDLDKVLVNARGPSIRQDWSDQLPIYPPTTLILLLPLSLLSYKKRDGPLVFPEFGDLRL